METGIAALILNKEKNKIHYLRGKHFYFEKKKLEDP